MTQIAIFYKKSQKPSSDWGKPPDVIRLRLHRFAQNDDKTVLQTGNNSFFCRTRSRKNNFSELELERE